MMAMILSSFAFLILLFVSKNFAMLLCPHNVHAEKGTNFTIACKVDGNVTDFYWYKGKASNQDLVGMLENGRKSVPQRYMDAYDISVTGYLIIVHAGIMHESLHTLVTFDSNGASREVGVIVNITISPYLACPLISNCIPCKKCELHQASTSGTLTCTVKGARPQVKLRWTAPPQSGVSVVKFPPQIRRRNASDDFWDSSATLDYEMIGSCGSVIVLQCVAEDFFNILQLNVSTIEIRNDRCKAITSLPNVPVEMTSSSKTSSLLAVTLVIPILVASGIVFWVIYTRLRFRRRDEQRQSTSYEPSLQPLLDSISHDTKAKELLMSLTKRYKKFCYLKPLPWVGEIPIASLYVDSQWSVKSKTDTSKMTPGEFRVETDIFSEKLVIFKAEHGFGRTTFLKQVVQEWIKTKNTIRLIIYIPLKNLTSQDNFSDILMGKLGEDCKFDSTDIERVLKTQNCLLILDGLENLRDIEVIRSSSTFGKERRSKRSKSTEGDAFHKVDSDETDDTNISYNNDFKISKTDGTDFVSGGTFLTIGELLKWQGNEDFTGLHVWVTSTKAACDTVSWPESYVEVKLTGFTDEQFQKYVEKCCKYYFNLKSRGRKANQKCNAGCNKVHEFLTKYKTREIFKETPLLVNMIVHILAAYHASAIRYLENKQITDMDTLMRIVIDAMEARYKNKNSLPSDVGFSLLEEKLGKLAARHNKKLRVMKRDIWEEEIGEKEVTVALQIGLLRFAADNRGIKFYHQHIQDYLADHVSDLRLRDKSKTEN